jgi:hypothetical protein
MTGVLYAKLFNTASPSPFSCVRSNCGGKVVGDLVASRSHQDSDFQYQTPIFEKSLYFKIFKRKKIKFKNIQT